MKKHWIILPLLIALLLGAGCAASPKGAQMYTESQMAPAAPMPAPAAAAPAEAPEMMNDMIARDEEAGWGGEVDRASAGAVGGDAKGNDYGGHKIIRNASLGIETREFDTHLAHIRQKVDEMGGYVSSSYTSGRKPETYNDSGRYANITARIPQERLNAFLTDTRGIATVTYENSSGEDITSSYYDTESRLQIYQSQRDRILSLLEKAETMEDIISLETELSRLTYEIEALTTQLKRWDNLVDFSTVSIDITEIPPSTPVSSNDNISMRISEGFSRTLNGMAVFFESLLVFIISALPALVLLAVVAAIVIFIVKRKKRNKPDKQTKTDDPNKYE